MPAEFSRIASRLLPGSCPSTAPNNSTTYPFDPQSTRLQGVPKKALATGPQTFYLMLWLLALTNSQ